MIVGQFVELLGGRLDHLLVAEAEPRAPQAGHAFDVAAPVAVIDIDALAALDDHRAGLLELVDGRVGMQDRLDVAGLPVAERRGSP